jgi:glycyl-tRNA synthetase beta subunit
MLHLVLYCCCRERLPALLSKLRLSHAGVEVHGTPRRLTALVTDLAPAQTPQESKVSRHKANQAPNHHPPPLSPVLVNPKPEP